ncbi:MAG TPA: hypothetical protein VM783_13560, partial [Candidatus Acidoferrum sp.]|nr:hypothetical protein [Candidatus Acidoferrum sp.]
MKNLRAIILSAMVAGVLIVPGIPATADAKDGDGHHHFRQSDRHGKFHGRRDLRHDRWERHDGRRDSRHSRWERHDGRHDKQHYRRDVRYDNRGHHNKPEIRQDFKDVRNARNEVKQG